MYEVEVKVRAAHEGVRERLASVGATRVGRVRQADVYYDAPDRDFAETDEALRIRRETPEDGDGHAVVTYKGPLVEAESKSREEFETAVADPDAMDDLLVGLGCEAAATVHKDRTRYELDGYTVTLDRVENLGEFVEVEREIETAAIEETREGAYDVLRRLDLDPSEQIRTSYLGLLLAEE